MKSIALEPPLSLYYIGTSARSVVDRITSARSVSDKLTSDSFVLDKVTIARASVSERVTQKLGLYLTG